MCMSLRVLEHALLCSVSLCYAWHNGRPMVVLLSSAGSTHGTPTHTAYGLAFWSLLLVWASGRSLWFGPRLLVRWHHLKLRVLPNRVIEGHPAVQALQKNLLLMTTDFLPGRLLASQPDGDFYTILTSRHACKRYQAGPAAEAAWQLWQRLDCVLDKRLALLEVLDTQLEPSA